MEKAIAIVQGLENVQAVSLLKRLHRNVFQAVPYEDLKNHLVAGLDEVEIFQKMDPELKKKSLDPETSIQSTRELLMAFAKNEDLAPILVQAWDEIKTDDSLFVEVIVAIGLLVNLTLFMATSEIEFKIGRLTIKKGRADSAILKEILSPVTDLIKGQAQVS